MPIGSYQHNIDAKGRVFMPAKFREELGENFVMCRGTVKCIFVFSKEGWNRFTANIVNIPTTDMQLQKFIRRLYASACEAETDKQGRILINQKLRDYAEVEKEMHYNGVQNRVEIWTPKIGRRILTEPTKILTRYLKNLRSLEYEPYTCFI